MLTAVSASTQGGREDPVKAQVKPKKLNELKEEPRSNGLQLNSDGLQPSSNPYCTP